MNWLLLLLFITAAFFLGRGWQAVKTDEQISCLIDNIESDIDLIAKQQKMIRDQRDYIDSINAAWQADRDRLNERGLL